MARRLVLAAALGVWALAPAPVHAALTQFADFTQTTGGPFTFTYNGTGATLSGTSQIFFSFDNQAGAPVGPQAATMTLMATTTDKATVVGPNAYQPITGPADVVKITRNSDGANLLTLAFTGYLHGAVGSTNASLAGDTKVGNLVAYTSAFITFPTIAASENAFQINFPTITPALSGNATTGFLNNFTSDSLGAFTTNLTPVPEPAAIASMAVGLAAAGLYALRRPRVSAV